MSEGDSSLSEGKIMAIFNGDPCTGSTMYFQCLEVETFNQSNTGQQRARMALSDGKFKMKALLPANNTALVQSEEMINGTIIQLNAFAVTQAQGTRLIVCNNLEILQKECEFLGAPKDVPNTVQQTAKPSGFGGNKGFGNKPKNTGFGQNNRNTGFGGGNNPFQSGGGGGGNYQDLSELSPFQKDFCVKVRITRKGQIRTWNNDRGSGKLSSFDILDSKGNEMQVTMFNDVVDKFFEVIQEGKVFTISKGRIKIANKRYTHIKSEYQLDLSQDSEIVCLGDDNAISGMKYDFKPLSALQDMNDKDYVDVCGVIDHVGEVQTFTSKKTEKELTKRNFRIVDQTNNAVECTLWGDEAQNFQESYMNMPITIKAARVSEFNGKSLSVNKYAINPSDVPECQTLQQWWTSGGNNTKFESMTQARGSGGRNEPPISLREVEQKGFGSSEDAQYFNTKVTIHRIPHSLEKTPWYLSVPEEEGPAYKVVEEDGAYRCEKNGKTYPNYWPRYILRMQCMDHTGEHWFNCFNDVAKLIMNMDAKVCEEFFNQQDEAGFNKCFNDAQFQTWNFRVRAKQEEFNEEMRKRMDVLGVTKIGKDNIVADSNDMLNNIRRMMTAC